MVDQINTPNVQGYVGYIICVRASNGWAYESCK